MFQNILSKFFVANTFLPTFCFVPIIIIIFFLLVFFRSVYESYSFYSSSSFPSLFFSVRVHLFIHRVLFASFRFRFCSEKRGSRLYSTVYVVFFPIFFWSSPFVFLVLFFIFLFCLFFFRFLAQFRLFALH